MIVIDSGNTNCKIWLGEKKLVKAYSEIFTSAEIDFLKSAMEKPVIFSSVAPVKFDAIVKLLEEIGFKSFVNIGEFVREMKPLGDEVKGMGADRILGMTGASTFLKTPLITVDCGTAVTVNFLLKEKLCAGGAIFAGYSTQMSALSSGTEGIRIKANTAFKKVIGTTTEEALHSGILHSIAGGIKILYENFLKESGIGKAEVVITGGDGEMIFKKLEEEKFSCAFKTDLVKLGIEEVFKNMSEIEREKYRLTENY